jgi:hypothetical protein
MPTPKASVIILSPAQRDCLEQLVRQTTNPYRLVRRAQIILAAAHGKTNCQIQYTVAIRSHSSADVADALAGQSKSIGGGRSQ